MVFAYRIGRNMRYRESVKRKLSNNPIHKYYSMPSYPFSARSIAGVRIVVRSILPEPNSLTVSTQAAAAPGTVTA